MEPFMLARTAEGRTAAQAEKREGAHPACTKEGRGNRFDPCGGNTAVCDRALLKGQNGPGTRSENNDSLIFNRADCTIEEDHSGRMVKEMTVRLVRKPAFGVAKSDRLKISLGGSHTVKQKIAMLMQVKFWLHEQGIDHAGPMDTYIPLLDPHGYPLTIFPDGAVIADYNLLIESPYHCAADDYDPRPPASDHFRL
jgi:hypothetical protein